MLKNIIPVLIILLIISSIAAGSWFLFRGDALINELSGLTTYSKAELVFLKEQGFLDEFKTREAPKNKEEALSLIKSATLIEQNLNSPDESFEVLATKLDKTSYQLAFKLENKSQEKKEFYLIPVSKDNQTEFQEIKGVINNRNLLSINKDDVKKEPLETLYDIQQHKRELNPELAKAYDDIDNNNYLAKPVKITLDAKSNIVAKSEWEIVGVGSSNPRGAETAPLQPVYLLVYGSAGGAKDELNGENPDGTKNYKNKWLSSYETICFDTDDRDIDFNQYAKQDGGYLIRTKPKSEAHFEFVDKEYNVLGLEEVQILEGEKCYYDEFLTAKGANAIWKNGKWEMDKMPEEGILRVQSTGKKYWDTARIKNHPQPERIEIVAGEEVIPEEPPQPHNKPQSIAFDATSNSGAKGNVSSYSWSHTTGAGDNRLLVVSSSHRQNDEDTITVSSITYNGVSLTSIRSDVMHVDPGVYHRNYLYYLVAPESGSRTVAITLSDTIYKGIGGANTYTGAAQTGQPDAHNGGGGYVTPVSVSVTTVADNSWVVSIAYYRSSETGDTLTCGNTQRWNEDVATEYLTEVAGYSDTGGPKTPAGSQTMSWSVLYGGGWVISAASFAPAEEAPSNNAPMISSVEDYPDPLEAGSTITFSVDWNDVDAEGVKMLICKTNAITAGASPSCNGGQWCSNDNDYDTTDPISCTYVTQTGNVGVQNYYAFVCDNEPSCSSSTSGTFTVQAASSPSKIFKGGIHFGR